MSDNVTTETVESQGLCSTCDKSIWCPTWAEMKCKHFERRIYGYAKLTDCKFYKKRGKNFKEPPCQCEDCLKVGAMYEEEE